MFRVDIETGADCGKVGMGLWITCQLIRTKLFPDTQASEGYNSIIKSLSSRARNIGLPLLSSRCNIKKALSVGGRGTSKKWSAVRHQAAHVLMDALEHSDATSKDSQLLQIR